MHLRKSILFSTSSFPTKCMFLADIIKMKLILRKKNKNKKKTKMYINPYNPKKRYLTSSRAPYAKRSAVTNRRVLPIPRPIGYRVARSYTLSQSDAKFFDIGSAAYACNTTGSVTHLDIIPQGTTISSREGKAYRVKSITVRGYIASDTACVYAGYLCYLIWDKQPNKALAGLTDILETASSSSFLKRENAARFVPLKKWAGVVVGNTTTPTTGDELCHIDDYVRFPKNLVANCTSADNTGVIGNRVNGALLLVTVGDVAAGNTDCNLITSFRINFTDKY